MLERLRKLEARLSRFDDCGRLVLRLAFGGSMFLAHGLKKAAAGPSDGFPDPLGVGSTASWVLAVFAEAGCAALVAVGLFTRFTLVPLIITMLVAAFVVHAGDPFGKRELALVYLAAYVALFLLGPGRYSMDAKIGNVQREPK